MNSENICYYSVHNLLSFRLISQNIQSYEYNFARRIWVSNLGCHCKGKTYAEYVPKQGAEEVILSPRERGLNARVEKTA